MDKKKLNTVLVIVLLLAIPFQSLLSMRKVAITIDEGHDLASGFSKLKSGDYRLFPEHGLFIPTISALPLLFMDINFPFEHESWQIKNREVITPLFFFGSGNDPYRMIFVARVMVVLLSTILGFIVYKWASELYGKKAGLLALFLYSLSPNMLAYGQLICSDFGLAFTSTISLYLIWKSLRKPSLHLLMVAGVGLGLALISKISAIFLLFVIVILIFIYIIKTTRNSKKFARFKKIIPFNKKIVIIVGIILIIFVSSYLVLILAYKFEGLFKPISEQMLSDMHLNQTMYPVEKFTGSNKILKYVFEKIPSPLPYYYVRAFGFSVDFSSNEAASHVGARGVNLVGYYFLLSFLVKTPIALILIFFISILFHKQLTKGIKNELFLLLPVVFHYLVFSFSNSQLGYRYLLLTIPLIMIFSGRIANLEFINKNHTKYFKILLLLLCFSYALTSIKAHPHYLSYYNQFVGQSKGYKVFIRSNTDWGQDLLFLVDYVHQHNISQLYLKYHGFPMTPDAASYYDISYQELKCGEHKSEGYAAVSVTHLVWFPECYSWLNNYEQQRIGYSIMIYNLTKTQN